MELRACKIEGWRVRPGGGGGYGGGMFHGDVEASGYWVVVAQVWKAEVQCPHPNHTVTCNVQAIPINTSNSLVLKTIMVPHYNIPQASAINQPTCVFSPLTMFNTSAEGSLLKHPPPATPSSSMP